ncbi:hypothetical protein ZIOFF_046927 [Zingiber officinale]|uniref:Subtilisin-like protease fibronectin type-III domain-containing protein n=1 Tax=Zingiber officinale TaxID=94328 RepID=A0A8J5FND8_ZINOF|nr:hypothetical protein ZIOFF_046927 [Zingiber officinale]
MHGSEGATARRRGSGDVGGGVDNVRVERRDDDVDGEKERAVGIDDIGKRHACRGGRRVQKVSEDIAIKILDMDLAPWVLFLFFTFFSNLCVASPSSMSRYVIQVEDPVEPLTKGSLRSSLPLYYSTESPSCDMDPPDDSHRGSVWVCEVERGSLVRVAAFAKSHGARALISISSKIEGATISIRKMDFPGVVLTIQEGSDLISAEAKVTRTVTNVGSARSSYTVSVTISETAVSATVTPKTLTFTELNEQKSFTVSAEWGAGGPPTSGNQFVEGKLTWTSDDDKYVVTSPLVVSALGVM